MTNLFDTMTPIERTVFVRDGVYLLCQDIDDGQVQPTEAEMMALADIVMAYGGPLKHNLLCMLASRCAEGRKALDAVAALNKARRS